MVANAALTRGPDLDMLPAPALPSEDDTGPGAEVGISDFENVTSACPFNPMERLAISLGSRDPLPGRGTHRRLARIAFWLFGVRGPQPLADKRLEALRVLVVSLRRRPRDAVRAIEEARAAGVPLVHIKAVLANQVGHRAPGAIDG